MVFARGNTLVIGGEDGGTDKLDHIWWNAGYQDWIMSTLLFTDKNQQAGKNDLAEKREYDESTMTHTFTLRPNLKFHDGSSLTTEDIRYNVRVALETPRVTPIVKSALKSIIGGIDFMDGKADSVSGMKVKSDRVISFTLSEPNALFLQGMSLLFIAPKKMLVGYEKGKFHLSDFMMKPIGSGPFKLKSRKPRDYTELVPFEDYHFGEAKIERVLMRPFGKESANAMRSGDLDYAFTNNMDMYMALEKDPNITSIAKDYAYLRFLLFKQDEPYMLSLIHI